MRTDDVIELDEACGKDPVNVRLATTQWMEQKNYEYDISVGSAMVA